MSIITKFCGGNVWTNNSLSFSALKDLLQIRSKNWKQIKKSQKSVKFKDNQNTDKKTVRKKNWKK